MRFLRLFVASLLAEAARGQDCFRICKKILASPEAAAAQREACDKHNVSADEYHHLFHLGLQSNYTVFTCLTLPRTSAFHPQVTPRLTTLELCLGTFQGIAPSACYNACDGTTRVEPDLCGSVSASTWIPKHQAYKSCKSGYMVRTAASVVRPTGA